MFYLFLPLYHRRGRLRGPDRHAPSRRRRTRRRHATQPGAHEHGFWSDRWFPEVPVPTATGSVSGRDVWEPAVALHQVRGK